MGVGGAGVGAGGEEVESTPSQPMKRRLLELGGVQVSERLLFFVTLEPRVE